MIVLLSGRGGGSVEWVCDAGERKREKTRLEWISCSSFKVIFTLCISEYNVIDTIVQRKFKENPITILHGDTRASGRVSSRY